VGVEIRNPRDEELREVMVALEAAFGSALEHEEDVLRAARATMPLDRVLTGWDDARVVAVAAAWPFRITIPGGEVPCGGVTWVGVHPTHRRRGLARELMRRQLDDLHARGEPLAALWASESLIYGRFGYGIAAPVHTLDADRASFAFRDDSGPEGSLRLVTREEAQDVLPPLYERIRGTRTGMLVRSEEWWREQRLQEFSVPPGAGKRFYAVLELDGADEGYAVYRHDGNWEGDFPAGTVRVGEALATSLRATREIWRFLFSIDLTTKVRCGFLDPAAPLFLGVRDPRRLQIGLRDGLWLRLVDVDAALRARSWNGDDSLVAEVRDAFCPWNDGRYRLGAGAGRTDDAPDLGLDVADLASLYLGGVDAGALHAAGRIEDRTARAVERVAALFRTPLPPFCPEVF
jgi:predicted acetyltransferase